VLEAQCATRQGQGPGARLLYGLRYQHALAVGGQPTPSFALFDRLLIVSEHHLRQVLSEYLRHYNTALPHRALGQLAPAQTDAPPPQINLTEHRIRRKRVLGGFTSEYQTAA
jgi:hypothetical protein